MKKYKDLDLKDIMEKANLDFAHFTYQRSMCSCCYDPKDLPARYWRNGVKKDDNDYPFILFKNAVNGSGQVTKNDSIENYTCVSWGNLTDGQVEIVCQMLQEQLGDEYKVKKPESSAYTIVIHTLESL